MDFSFLKSVRFWKLFLVGLSAAVEEYSRTANWSQALFIGITVWLGGSVAVKTVDRAAEVKADGIVSAAEIAKAPVTPTP